MDLDISDRVYVVTGGARGLGRATADILVAEGARVVASARSTESLAAMKADLGDAVTTVVADNADPETPRRLIAAAQDTWGRLDGGLISVGGPPRGTVASATDAQWTTAFGSVFLGAVRMARELVAALGEGGSVAFVLSTSVKAPLTNMAISNGLRPGLAMVAKELADEVGPSGIRVNALLPGRVGTERVLGQNDASGDPAAARAASERTIPLRRFGEPAEFGRAAAFLLSPASSFITGVMLPVDGGLCRAL